MPIKIDGDRGDGWRFTVQRTRSTSWNSKPGGRADDSSWNTFHRRPKLMHTLSGGLSNWRDRGRFIEILGREICVVTAGSDQAPALLILHGFPAFSYDFTSLTRSNASVHLELAHLTLAHRFLRQRKLGVLAVKLASLGRSSSA